MYLALKIILGVLGAIVCFVLWRLASVARGGRKRDDALISRLEPLGERFDQQQDVSAAEVLALAQAPELRQILYQMLLFCKHADLFPAEFLTARAQAETALAYWLLHPNELGAVPSQIEPIETLRREIRHEVAEFHVFRYKMPEGHWAGPDWLLGLTGPHFADDKPYQGVAAGFSRMTDKFGEVSVAELVDWYVGMLKRKFGDAPRTASVDGPSEAPG